MMNKTYSYEVIDTETVGDACWVYMRVVSVWNVSKVIHQRESKGWICLDKDISIDYALYSLDRAAEDLTWMEPSHSDNIYGYLKDRLHTELLQGNTNDHIEIPFSTLVEKFGQEKVDSLVGEYLFPKPHAEDIAIVDFDMLDGVCITRKTHKFEYMYDEQEDD